MCRERSISSAVCPVRPHVRVRCLFTAESYDWRLAESASQVSTPRAGSILYRVLQRKRKSQRKCEEPNDKTRGEAGIAAAATPRSPSHRVVLFLHTSALAFFEVPYLFVQARIHKLFFFFLRGWWGGGGVMPHLWPTYRLKSCSLPTSGEKDGVMTLWFPSPFWIRAWMCTVYSWYVLSNVLMRTLCTQYGFRCIPVNE